MNKQFELTDDYIKKLKTLLRMKKITSYDVAHASFRKANQHCIISSTDKRELCITFINGDKKKFSNYFDLMKEVNAINSWYKTSRRKYIKRYYKVIDKWNNRHKNAKPTENQFVKLIEKYNV
jgi:hypothetical protein